MSAMLTRRMTAGLPSLVMGALVCVNVAVARADTDTDAERQACALMDDYGASIHAGMPPGTYALAVLSKQMPQTEAQRVLAVAIHDFCPNHLIDLPPGW